MKKIFFAVALLFCLNIQAQDSTATDNTEKKVYVSFFAGNTGMVNNVIEDNYSFFPSGYFNGQKNEMKINVGLELSFKMKKKMFFNINWNASILNHAFSEDTREVSANAGNSSYNLTDVKINQLCYSIKPGISQTLFEQNNFLFTAGFNIPFVALGKYTSDVTYSEYDVSGLITHTNTKNIIDASYILGLEASASVKYLACKKFFLTGSLSYSVLHSWSNSDLLVKTTDLITNAPPTQLVYQRSFSTLGTSDVCANLGFGFRF